MWAGAGLLFHMYLLCWSNWLLYINLATHRTCSASSVLQLTTKEGILQKMSLWRQSVCWNVLRNGWSKNIFQLIQELNPVLILPGSVVQEWMTWQHKPKSQVQCSIVTSIFYLSMASLSTPCSFLYTYNRSDILFSFSLFCLLFLICLLTDSTHTRIRVAINIIIITCKIHNKRIKNNLAQ